MIEEAVEALQFAKEKLVWIFCISCVVIIVTAIWTAWRNADGKFWDE